MVALAADHCMNSSPLDSREQKPLLEDLQPKKYGGSGHHWAGGVESHMHFVVLCSLSATDGVSFYQIAKETGTRIFGRKPIDIYILDPKANILVVIE